MGSPTAPPGSTPSAGLPTLLAAKAGLEELGSEPVEAPLKGIMRRYALGLAEADFEPGAAPLSEGDHLLSIIGPTENRTKGDHADIEQGMAAEMLAARIT